MDPERFRRIKEIADAALDRTGPARAEYVAQACAGDAALRLEVDGLIAAARAADAGDFLARSAADAPTELGGEHRYRLVREIGRGGMGTVYLAERADGEFRQRVALKLMHHDAGADAAALKRFRAERQILADLEHPNIARLVDGGSLADGRPFLVMELIDGERLDAWCETRSLSTEARVRLFLKVCAAVAYAHQNLVVHRDLKPGNILVDTTGEPKLLDFGIAKLIEAEPGTATATQDRLMTFGYASPEQVRGAAVGTASDVYSLGVVLYRLLTGKLPYRVPEESVPALARAIVEDEPTPASDRLRGEPPTLDRARPRLDRDLDEILAKALRKEPRQRYGSAEQLADDLCRWLDGHPVLARRGSGAYRARKFVARHRVAVAAALTFLALVLGFAWERQQQLALAKAERDRAQRLVEFMTGLFENADPEKSGGRKLPVADVLDVAARRLQADDAQQPLDRAAMLHALGTVYRALGDFDRAAELLGHARGLRRADAGAALEAAESALALGGVEQMRNALDAADALYRESRAALAARWGDADWRVAEMDARLASVRSDRGDREGAQADLVAARDRMLASLGLAAVPASGGNVAREPALALSGLLTQLGRVAHERKDWASAEPALTQALALRRPLVGPDDPVLSLALTATASMHRERGRLAESEALRREVVTLREKVYGPDHWQTGVALINLGDSVGALGRADEAHALAKRAETLLAKALGPNHRFTLVALGNQSTTAVDKEAALGLAREVLRRRREVLPPDHPDVALALWQVATKLAKLDRPAESFDVYTESFAIYAKHYGGDHPYLDENRVSEADVLIRVGRFEEAERRLRDVVAHVGHADANPQITALGQFMLAKLLVETGRARDEALALANAAAATAHETGKTDAIDPAEIDAWLAATR